MSLQIIAVILYSIYLTMVLEYVHKNCSMISKLPVNRESIMTKANNNEKVIRRGNGS